MTPWSPSALHQAVERDNSMQMIELLVDHGAASCCFSNERHRSPGLTR